MSAPGPRPPTNWSRSLVKITAFNRFARAEDAGIRPGEDAQELTARRLHSAAKRTASPNAAHSSPGGVPDRLKRLQRGPDPQPPRKGSTSSEYSASSNASYGSNGSGGSSSTSTGPIPRRTSDHRVLPYRLNDPARTPNLQRAPMVVLDATESEPPSCSQFSNYWNESPQLRPISDTDRTITVVESVISSSVASDATAMTGYTLPDPGPDRLYFPTDYRPQHCELNGRPVIMASPPFSPGLRSLDPFDALPTSFSPQHPPKTPTRLQDMSADSSHQESSQSDVEYQTSPYEHGTLADSNVTIQRQPEPGSSGSSSDDPPTPTSDHGNSDDAASDCDESEAPSEDSQDTRQRDFLEEILRPVKRQLVDRLMVYVANTSNLRVPMLPMRPRSPGTPLKTEVATPTSDFADLKLSSGGESETPSDWHGNTKSAIAYQSDSNDVQENPGPTSQKSTVSRGYGKRAVGATASHANRFQSNGGQKRKAVANNNSPNGNDDDDDDGGDRHRNHKSRRSQSPSAPSRRIACPYHQRNPLKPPKADSCFRNGFKDIAKMKEHLDRVHDHSIQCPRCFAVFKQPLALNTHLRLPTDQLCTQAAVTATATAAETDDAYTAAQATQLKERMKNQGLERKWKAIWRILFPADGEGAIKPPWWTPQPAAYRGPGDVDAVAAFFARYEGFSRADLPRRITPRVVGLVDELLLAGGYLGGLVDGIVGACLEESFAAFKAGEAAAAAAAAGDGAVGGPSSSAEVSGPSTSTSSFAGHAAAVGDGAGLFGARQRGRGMAALQQQQWGPVRGTGYGEIVPVPQQQQQSTGNLTVTATSPVPTTGNVSVVPPPRGAVDGYGQDVGAGFLDVGYGVDATQTPSVGLTPEGPWEDLTMFGELYADEGVGYDGMGMGVGGRGLDGL